LVNTLFSEDGQIRQDMWERGQQRIMGITDTLGAAIAALLANGQEPAEAVREAQEYLFQATQAAFRPGMGAYLPDRFFWARSSDEEVPPSDGKDTAQGDAGHYPRCLNLASPRDIHFTRIRRVFDAHLTINPPIKPPHKPGRAQSRNPPK